MFASSAQHAVVLLNIATNVSMLQAVLRYIGLKYCAKFFADTSEIAESLEIR